MEYKTPEEILKEIQVREMAVFTSNEMFVIISAMEQYGKQQYNKAVFDCVENVNRIALDHQSICFIKNSMLKLLKQ